MNGTDDPRPLTERIRQIAVGLPLGKCHRQEAMCNHEGCRLKNLEALEAEVGELERDKMGAEYDAGLERARADDAKKRAWAAEYRAERDRADAIR